MKTSAALLLLCAAAASAQWGVKPNNQYEYRFVAKLMTGIPEISSQYSGMGLRATLLVQAPSADVIQFKLKDTEMAELKNKLVELPWHQSFPLNWQPVTDIKQLLEQPFKVKVQEGKIVEFIVGGNEPESMVNMKKAIVQRWQMTMKKEVIAEFPTGKFFDDVKQPLYFEVEEESIGGVCKTGYTVTPILEPQTQLDTIKSFGIDVFRHWSWTEQNIHTEVKKPRFMLTKNILHHTCKRRAMFQKMSPAPLHCRNNVTDCFNTHANSTTIIRYLMRGQRNTFEIEAISSIGVHLMYPFQLPAEQLTTGTNQTMILLGTKPIASPFPDPPQPRTLKQIRWSVLTKDKITPEQDFLPKPTLTEAPIINMAVPIAPLNKLLEKITLPKMKLMALEIITSLDASFDQVPDPATRDTPGMVRKLVSMLNMMSLADLKEIYSKIPSIAGRPAESIDVMKKVFRETVANTGTNPCIMMVKEWIEQKEVVGAEAATLVMMVPMSIKTPTVEILRELFKLLRNGIAENDEHLRQNMMLSFAKTVNIACIRRASTHNAFPVGLFKDFCNYESQPITKSWIPFFTKRVTSEVTIREKMVLLKSMSMLQHPDVVPTLMEMATKKTENVHVREMAIYGMMEFRTVDPVLVERVVKPIALDKNEFSEVRMAATTVLLILNPSLATYQQMALNTWTENDLQLTNFVSSFLEQAANLTDIDIPLVREIREKARVVFRLTRPTLRGDLWTQVSLVRSQIDLLMVTAEMDTITTRTPFDTWGSWWSGRMRSYQHMLFTPLILHSKVIGIQNVIDLLMSPDSPQRITRYNRGSEPVQTALAEFAEIRNLLKITKRENEPFVAWLQATIMGSMERVFTFDQKAIQNYLQTVGTANTYTTKMKNFQKVMNLMDHTIGMPTDVGVPMMMIRQAPAVLSMRGDITLDMKKSSDGNRVVRMDVKQMQPFFNVKMMALVGAVNPLTMKMMSAGVEHNIMMSLPLTATAECDTKSSRVEVYTKFINTPNKINLLRMETSPFTTAFDITTGDGLSRQNPDTKPINIRTPTSNEIRIGKEMFGVDLMMRYKSQDDFGNMMDFFTKMMATRRVGNWMTILPTIRPNLMMLALDTAGATTNKMVISLAMDKFRRHHTMETINNPEAEPVEQIEWLGDKAQYRDEKHAVVEKDARREVMKRARTILTQIHTGEAFGWTMVVSTLGMKENRMALKWLRVKDSSRLNIKNDIRWVKMPSDDMPTKKELIVNTHIQWPRVGRTLNELLMADMYAPMEATASLKLNDNRTTHIATLKGALRQTQLMKMWSANNQWTRACRENRNNGFVHAPVCEKARIMASRLNSINMEMTVNTEFTKNSHLVMENELPTLGWTVKDPVTKMVKRNKASFMDLITKFLTNKFVKFPRTIKPSYLEDKKKRKMSVNFNPFSKTWDMFVDNAKMSMKVRDIRPTEMLWKTNGVYNVNNDFGLSLPWMPFLNINEGFSAYEDNLDKARREQMGEARSKCVIDERFIKTFDNVTFPVDMANNCWHMIAGDCSQKTNLAVLVKQMGSRRAVRVITSTRIIELLPTGLDYYLKVDKKDQRLLPVGQLLVLESANKETEARLLKWTTDWLELELPVYGARLRIIGAAVELQLEPKFLRNRACGICGDMNGETYQDLTGPKRCLMFTGRDLQTIYMADKQCQKQVPQGYGDDCVKVKREQWMVQPPPTGGY